MLKIGPYCRASKVIVAPMAGVSDQPFRNLCRRFGAQWVVSEMVSSNSRVWHTEKSQQRFRFHDEPEPRWIQIAGADPVAMAEVAVRNVALGAQIIDINMGCPAKKVCNKAAGSALLRDENLVASILSSVVSAVDTPVTLKIRLGWSRDEINAVTIAKIAQDSGIALLSVHGRTRACRFTGKVDYQSIGHVKNAISIPVIANGDVNSPEDALAVLRETGADGVMIGRAAQGRPWLSAAISHFLETGEKLPEPSYEQLEETLKDHVQTLSDFYGEYKGVRIARKHVGWYLQNLPGYAPMYKSRFNSLDTLYDQINLIDRYFDELPWLESSRKAS